MNSGLRDAVGLSWRLPLALKGNTSELLLDSYGTEVRGTMVNE
jgi:2-polyprenyl-6-methoxyphenol hydroxylase-like FAD-dependent oxidoreductase